MFIDVVGREYEANVGFRDSRCSLESMDVEERSESVDKLLSWKENDDLVLLARFVRTFRAIRTSSSPL